MRVEERIGPYRVLEELGVGGMGEVSLALDPRGRAVAVKVLHPAIARDDIARKRLEREVATMRLVRGPHVAEVLDADFTARRPYLVTRYAQGRTLEEVVRGRGPLRGAALTRVVRGLARSLTAIHGAQIVHRDLKPANVILVDGEPVVIDFGLAHVLDATRLTLTGTAIGTPGYLAPEILDGHRATPASDVFSWAATVVFAATGRSPFGSGPPEAVFSRVLRGRPDLTGVPRDLVPILRAALSRDARRRPQTADLPGGANPIPVPAPAPPPPSPPVARPARPAALPEPAATPGLSLARPLAVTALPAACLAVPMLAAAACLGWCLFAYARDAWQRMRARLSGDRDVSRRARLAALVAVPLEVAVRLVILAGVVAFGYAALFAVLQMTALADRVTLPFGLLAGAAIAVRGRYDSSARLLERVGVPVLAALLLAAVAVAAPDPSWWPLSGR
ncbi:serine/threonine-protein kinase [Actinomadura hibisca]|uniref:serine/threonine-protein kinase n=1 Tax=Actinomadura hibisca TaxID=68565 RepID=UPI00082D4DE0|nr:serine/threonine-protein kinase [Actinomadura hibisca]